MTTATLNSKPRRRLNAELLDSEPPNDPAAEQAVLGSIMLDSARLPEVSAILGPGDFRDPKHQIIYRHLLGMGDSGIDTMLLGARLQESGDLPAAGGLEYVAKVGASVPVAAHAVHYAKIVKDHAIRRGLIHAAAEIVQEAYAGSDLAALRIRAAGILTPLDSVGQPESLLFPSYTLANLKRMDLSIRYYIDGILAQNQPLVLAGAKKVLKTSLLLDLAFSLATCGKFLGYFHVLEAARVGIMTGESGLAVVLETAERIARAAGRAVEDVPGLVVSDKIPLLASLPHLDALRAWIADNELTVLAIDPLYLALDDTDPGNLFAVGKVLRNIGMVCQDAGVTLIICHHTKKGVADPFQPGELEDLAWAGTAEWCRQWMMISRREKYVPGTGEHKLWMSVGGSAGHSGYWGLDINEGTRATPGGRFWDVRVLTPDRARESAKEYQEDAKQAERDRRRQRTIDRDKRAILNAMAKYPQGETARTLRERAGLAGGRFNNALSELLAAEEVVPTTITKSSRKTPFDAYKLVEGT